MKTRDELAVNFGERLWGILQEKAISYCDIAEALGVSKRIIYCYVNGEKMPEPDKFYALMNYLDVSAEDLLSW